MDRLRAKRRQGLCRQRRILETPQGVEPIIDGRRYLAFCSNDYLGLASHPKVVDALALAARRFGVGSGASHLVTGHAKEHHALEAELAEFTRRPRALLFSTGYMANLGVLQTLIGRRDHVFADRLNHASLVDAATLSRAHLHRYHHAEPLSLEQSLSNTAVVTQRLVVTDGLFSMDGDLAPLPRLSSICEAHGAWLAVDDAHGLGVLGKTGRGTLEVTGMDLEQVPILVGTLGKAIGTFGAFVAGSEELIEVLIQEARSYIYTTALPPAVAAATRESLRLVQTEPWRRERLNALIQRFRGGLIDLGLKPPASETAIQPIILGSVEATMNAARGLLARGIYVTPIRPPTVPKGQSRLRITFSASHRKDHVDRLLEALSEVLT